MEEGFTHGLAQLLLNLTLKNMFLMEQWDDVLDPIRTFIHIPVTNKIIEAAWEDLEIALLCKNGEDSKTWRKWNYNEYTAFQDAVRKVVSCPLDWVYSVNIKANAERGNGACST